MNIALVDPIAATANVSARSILRPEVPSVGRDIGAVREAKLVELATQLALRGHRPTVLFGDVFLDGQPWTSPEGVRVVPVDTVMRFPFHPGLLPATPGLLGHPALSEADVIQVAEFHQLATLFSCITARDYSVPVVVWQETFRRMRFPGSLYQHAYESTVGRYVRARARRFIPRTTKARSYLRELRVADDRIGPWIPTGINVDAFASRKTRMSAADLGWPEGSPILLLVGRLHPTKGIDVALRTLRWVIRKHANAKLVVRGSGPERANLLQLARELHVEGAVRIIDRMPREAMVDLYNLADVVLCTSRVDLMPFSLIEASACCRPAVATDVGAIRDIVVDGRSGFVVEPGNIEAIGSAVSSLLADEGLRRAMGTEARHIAEQRFALPVVAGKLLQVYRNVAV